MLVRCQIQNKFVVLPFGYPCWVLESDTVCFIVYVILYIGHLPAVPFFENKLYILEKFCIHSKIQQKYRVPIYPLPPQVHSLPHNLHLSVERYILKNLY